MKLKFNHIGIACENISEVIVFLESTFNIVSKSKIIYHENHGVDACLLTNDDGTNIELVSGKNIESFVKKKQFLYHSCWEVNNIDTAIKSFCDNDAVLISEPKESLLFNNRKVAFLYTSVGILELLESE
jgi:methylmalonyl-CoA/ethylmalonyl-CoA epimerase